MKKANKYSDELKEQIIRECQEVGNVAVVARRYEISSNTIHTWIKKYREPLVQSYGREYPPPPSTRVISGL